MSHVHVVKQGECLTRIAASYGFGDYRDIYDHPANAEFKRKRPNPNLIFPGDRITIPSSHTPVHRRPTGSVHKFVVNVSKRKLMLALEDVDRRRMAGVPCTVRFGSTEVETQTDSEGILDLTIHPQDESGTITAGGYEWPLQIGHLNPVEETSDEGISGLQARLRNLGFDPGNTDGNHDTNSRNAVRAFQATQRLNETGEFDVDTRRSIIEKYGM